MFSRDHVSGPEAWLGFHSETFRRQRAVCLWHTVCVYVCVCVRVCMRVFVVVFNQSHICFLHSFPAAINPLIGPRSLIRGLNGALGGRGWRAVDERGGGVIFLKVCAKSVEVTSVFS
ncbi:unnamed protein product [Gadus morhua 'NCC']